MSARREFFKTLRKNKSLMGQIAVWGGQAILSLYNFTQFLGKLLGWYWYGVLGYAGLLWLGAWLNTAYRLNEARWPYLMVLLFATWRLWEWRNDDTVRLTTKAAPHGLLSYGLAGFKAAHTRMVLNSWTPAQKKSAGLKIQKDYVFILGYVSLLVYTLLWIRAMGGVAGVENAALYAQLLLSFCWVVVLTGILDGLENQALLWLLAQKDEAIIRQPIPFLGAVAATVKTWGLVSAVALVQLSAITGFLKLTELHAGVYWWNLFGAVLVGTMCLIVLFLPQLKRLNLFVFEHLMVLLALGVTVALLAAG